MPTNEKLAGTMKKNPSRFPLNTNATTMISQFSDPVEDYPQGYPRFSALVGASGQFHLCRRFSNLRSRLLLLKQDKLSLLESQLEKVDRDEDLALYLGSLRVDKNEKRLSLLTQINDALADYGTCTRFSGLSNQANLCLTDALIERNFRVFGYETARSRDIASLQNWVNGNACIARAETAYLGHEEELIGVPLADGGASGLEAWIEDWLIWCHKLFRKVGKVSEITQLLYGHS